MKAPEEAAMHACYKSIVIPKEAPEVDVIYTEYKRDTIPK
jgi:hypothetical protein